MKVEVDSDEFAALLKLSADLFGNQDRLLVAAAVADARAGDLFGQALAEELGIVQTRVGGQLKSLVKAGVLIELPRGKGDRRVFYERRPSAFWEMAQMLRNEVVAGQHPAISSLRPPGHHPARDAASGYA